MSIKSFIQILLLILIISIITAVYFKYFDINKNIVEEINSVEIDNQEKFNVLCQKLVFNLDNLLKFLGFLHFLELIVFL